MGPWGVSTPGPTVEVSPRRPIPVHRARHRARPFAACATPSRRGWPCPDPDPGSTPHARSPRRPSPWCSRPARCRVPRRPPPSLRPAHRVRPRQAIPRHPAADTSRKSRPPTAPPRPSACPSSGPRSRTRRRWPTRATRSPSSPADGSRSASRRVRATAGRSTVARRAPSRPAGPRVGRWRPAPRAAAGRPSAASASPTPNGPSKAPPATPDDVPTNSGGDLRGPDATRVGFVAADQQRVDVAAASGLRRQVFGFLPYWELNGASTKLNHDVLSTIAYFSVGATGDRRPQEEGPGRQQHHRLGRLDELEHDARSSRAPTSTAPAWC